MVKDLIFLSEKELNDLVKNNPKKDIILWGVGFVSDDILNTLQDLHVYVAFFGDSNEAIRGQKKSGIDIISPDDMKYHLDDIVIISSYGYLPIYKMLKDRGVKKIYALRDVYKYPLSEMMIDNMIIPKTVNDSAAHPVLLELYGNIGDVIIRIGIVKRFIEKFGKENVYLLFNNETHAELFRLITDKIICITVDDLKDRRRRQKLLIDLNELGITKSFVLCDIRLFALHRIINDYNSNIPETIFCSLVPENEYLPGIDIKAVCDYLKWHNEGKMTGWNQLSKDVLPSDNNLTKGINNYVVVNLGASKKVRQYDAEAFVPVMEWLINKGYKVVLVGAGEHDEMVASFLEGKNGNNIINMTSKLSLTESAKVMSDAALFVGTDSAMSHVAYIVGIPSVVIMGRGEYGSFMHNDGEVTYVSVEEMTCDNCKWYCDKVDSSGRAMCVYKISAIEIIKAIERYIGGKNA